MNFIPTQAERDHLDFLNGRTPLNFTLQEPYRGSAALRARVAARREAALATGALNDAAGAAVGAAMADKEDGTRALSPLSPPERVAGEGLTSCDGAAVAELAAPQVEDEPVSPEDPVPLPAAEEPPSSAVPSYRFPELRTSGTYRELRVELDTLAEDFRVWKDYLRVRDRFCAVSIAMNDIGLLAPRFRPQPLVKPVGRDPGGALLHKDHLVIDVHWLRATKSGSPFVSTYADLFSADQPFDFERAAAYASEKWSSDFRAVDHFGLADHVQWQLVTLKSKPHAERHRVLLKGAWTGKGRDSALVSAARRRIANWAARNHRIHGQEQTYLDLWVACEMLGPKAGTKQLTRLVGLMSGEAPRDESTMRQKLKSLKACFGPVS